jgi:ATP-binding cassette subfamily B protein
MLCLAWAASPLAILFAATLTVVAGVVPIANAWLNRTLLNALVPARADANRAVASRLAAGRALADRAPQSAHGVNSGHIVMLAVIIGCIGLAAATLPYARRYAEAELRRRLGLLTSDRVSRAINSFPGLSRFESPTFSDKTRLAQQVSDTSTASLVSAVMTSGQSLITASGMLAILVVVNPVLAMIVGGTAVPALVAQVANSRRSASLEWQKSPMARRQMFYSRLLTGPAAAMEIRLFGIGDFIRDRMLAELRAINDGHRSLDRRILSAEGSLALLGSVITAGGLIWTVGQAVAGRLPIGDVSMLVMAVVGVQGAISTLIARFADVYQSLLIFRHYEDVVTAGPDLPVSERPQPLPPLRDGIEIADVWFRYDEEHPWVLRGVNMFIPRGASVALIGLNGAGKSTLVKLLCRLYDPQRGSIRWDGTDLRDVAPAELRQRIGTVFQDYMCYDLTAAENIGLGDLERLGDRERIRAAAERAGIHRKLSTLPKGYDTLLSRVFFDNRDKEDSSTGVVLSGGQWQRLAAARGMMRADRDLLILDEPSSGLDAQAEHALHQRLRAIRDDRTSLLISHRLGSLRDADVIFVLSDGQIIEQGTHRGLMAAHGEYQRLFALQASGYQDQSDEPDRLAAGLPA